MDARINIYNPSGLLLRSPLITKKAEKVESLMTSDYIELSWNDITGGNLPAGAYILHDGERYTLKDMYIPEQRSACEWAYSPQFVSRTSLWSKVPFFFYNRDAQGSVISKEPDWNLTDTAPNFMQCIAEGIKAETGEEWTCVTASDLTGYRTIPFEATDIFSALNLIAGEWETEWLADKSSNTLFLGKAMRSFQAAPQLTVGENIGMPQVTPNKEGDYNRFYVFGSSRNIAQGYAGANVNNLVNKRLTLDPNEYPGGYIDRRGSEQEPIMSKVLTFEDIYPKSSLVVTECRPRLLYTLDENGNKVQVGTDETGQPIFDIYAIWYIQLASKNEDGSTTPFRLANTDTYGKDNPDGILLPGKPLSIHFNSGALTEREFELIYHSKASTISTSDGVPFQVKVGDFEIIFNSDSDYIIPAVTGIVPAEGDKAILFNLRMPDEYIAGAYLELKKAALEEITSVYEEDNNNYEISSNPIAFKESPALLALQIGQKVAYRNGDYTYETRIISKTSKLDFPFEQTLVVGNARIKGNTETLKEQVTNSSKDINLLMSFNELVQATIKSYNRTILAMQEGFNRINRMWQFDEAGNVYSEYNVYSVGEISAFGFQEGEGAPSVGIDEEALAEYLKPYAKKTDIPAAPDLSPYAKKTDIPSLSGYATEQWVLDKKYLTAHQDLSAYLKSADAASTYLKKTDAASTYLAKTDAATLYQPKGSYALASDLTTHTGNDDIHFTAAERTKLAGIAAGANAYTHPTATASTIAAASGKVLSSITVNSLGHVTAVGSKTLAEADIPALAISKVTGLQTALDAKLAAATFSELFEKVNVGTASAPRWVIKAKYGLYSVDEISAFGFQEGTAAGSGGVGINASELGQYLADNGYATQAWVLGKKYLTAHQSLADYLKTRVRDKHKHINSKHTNATNRATMKVA